jgi:hypothetical protein
LGLKNYKKQRPPAPRRPTVAIDMSPKGVDQKWCFHSPGVADAFVAGDQTDRLRVDFPDYPPKLLSIIATMASCYEAEASDEETDIPFTLAEMARDDAELFLYLVEQFGEAFPASNFAAAKAAAKNDSAEESAPSSSIVSAISDGTPESALA